MLCDGERVALGEGDDPLSAPTDGKAEKFPSDRIHAAIRLAVENDAHGPHESPLLITVPLILLSIGAIFAGYLNAAPFASISEKFESFTKWVEPGAACDELHACIHGYCAYATMAAQSGTCPLFLKDGERCSEADASKTCGYFSQCADGVCTSFTAACK